MMSFPVNHRDQLLLFLMYISKTCIYLSQVVMKPKKHHEKLGLMCSVSCYSNLQRLGFYSEDSKSVVPPHL